MNDLGCVIVVSADGNESAHAETVLSLREQMAPESIVAAHRIASAIREIPRGIEYFGVVRAGAQVTEHAVRNVVRCLEEHPGIDVVFGDETVIDVSKSERLPLYKAAWSPERLASVNDFDGFTTYRRELIDVDLMGTEQTPSAQLHDLALVASGRSTAVAHLPQVLCHNAHSRDSENWDERCEVVQRHFERNGVAAKATVFDRKRAVLGFAPVVTNPAPRVSVVIPTGGHVRRVRGQDLVLIDNALESLLHRSSYPELEVIVVLDRTSDAALAERIAAFDPQRIRTVKDDRPFNFSAACNLGVDTAAGEICVLLNDDTEIVEPAWLERLVTLLSFDEVGVVGAKLLYGDGRVQHAGVARRRGLPDHIAHGYPGDDDGHGRWLISTVNCFAATGACLAVRKRDWIAVGGMDTSFPLNFNDVDLCLRMQRLGRRVVVDNQTTLTHLETSSRESGSEQWEVDRFLELWPETQWGDLWDNPNFVDVGMERIPTPLPLVDLRTSRYGTPAARVVRQ